MICENRFSRMTEAEAEASASGVISKFAASFKKFGTKERTKTNSSIRDQRKTKEECSMLGNI